jgi:UDPglucose 6-dehydrogenase
MNIGFMGLGKLGLPCALAVNSVGHNVFGFDVDQNVKSILEDKVLPYREEGAEELLRNHSINWSSISELVSESDVIFVPIQTPHDPMYEGVTRLPDERVDFNYDYLVKGMETLSSEISRQGQPKVVVIISTVLPGTIRERIIPVIDPLVKLCYNPFFIAMGTTIRDFMNPEFVLFGVEDQSAFELVEDFYATLHDKPIYQCTVEEAELIKVTYNTFITMKICLANLVMEISHKLDNIDCDNVSNAIAMSTDRLISPKYLFGGMADGGGCHPRDNIALSWLARKIDLSYDWYDSLMTCRENQTDWLAELICDHKEQTGLPVVILGKTFKKETNLTVGSPAVLLDNLLKERSVVAEMYDPWVDEREAPLSEPSVFFIGTNHDLFKDFVFPSGSVVIDPWGMFKDREIEGVNVVSIGRGK